MKAENFCIHGIPAVLYGEESESLFLFLHGKMGHKEEAVSFAALACPKGYQVLSIDLPGHGQRQAEMERFVPWEVVPELQAVQCYLQQRWKHISLYANSIAAYFAMLSFRETRLERCFFVSPIVDMTLLISSMMEWAGVTEEVLRRAGEIATSFGETLSWRYRTYAQEHPITQWNCPTAILYAGGDHLTPRHTIQEFAGRFGCKLAVMEQGEHWFHTQQQLDVLHQWLQQTL